jgi:hypothetical protein
MSRAACTIITANYLAYAETLAETLARHNPDLPLYVLIVDPPADFDRHQFTAFKPLYLDLFADQAPLIEQMSFYYTAPEFCWSLRGFLHEYMLEQTQHESWVFLDSDMMINGSLDPIFEQLSRCSILLNPHFQKTGYLPAGSWIELSVLRVGKFNGGFLGLRRSPAARAFIDWFKARLARFCFDAPRFEGIHTLYSDQLWLDLVPIHFQDVELLRHPGANLAHWNLFEREMVLHASGEVSVDGQPLLFTHFSGWSIEDPTAVSRHSPHYTNPPNIPAWEKIGQDYRDRLMANGYAEKITWPYGFARFSNGEEITYEQRRLYYNDLRDHERRHGQVSIEHPFNHPEHLSDRPLDATPGLAFVGEELTRNHRALGQTQQQLVETQQQLANKQQQLVETQQQLATTHQQVETVQTVYQDLEEQLAQAQTHRADLQDQVNQRQQQLTETQQNHSALQRQNDEVMVQLQARIDHIEDLRRQTADQGQQIAQMENSKFWKIGVLWYSCLHQIKQKLKT